MTTLEQLERGRERISQGWAQQVLVKPTGCPDPQHRYSYCALGALLSDPGIRAAASDHSEIACQELKFYTEAQYELASAAREIWRGQFEQMDDSSVIINVNDGFATDVSEVLAMYDRAIKNVRARESAAVPAAECELATAGD